MGEMGGEHVSGDAAQVEALAARQHRHRHLVHLRRCQHELHMFRRLLQRLQQSIESIAGKHVNFIDDINLVSGRIGAFARYIDDRTNIVDRSEEHTSELQSLMRNSYAGLCLKKKTTTRKVKEGNT